MKVVALISGGKDSLFSILHCQANGYEVVALANLHPSSDNGESSDDIDSYMYQTIGHTVIPLYEKALGLPLYRQEILGGAFDQNKSYASPNARQEQSLSTSQDETESLVPLLRTVMAKHPEVNAVSTGAILSDYQRTRVESVAIRLGLVPLSYLWQFPFLPPYTETSLLDDMISAGQDARIIKVASGGLDDSFLWENVASTRTKTRLVRAMERFGITGDGAALGEGGEFETLAIDGPRPLWKHSITVDEGDRLVVTGEAGAASLKIATPKLTPKEESTEFSCDQLRKPSLLDDKFGALQDLIHLEERSEDSPAAFASRDHTKVSALSRSSAWTVRTAGSCVTISNAMEDGSSAGEQMTKIMNRLTADFKINPSAVAFTTILLRDMSDFGAANLAYGACFTAPSPPARVTVACGDTLPAGIQVSLSVTVLQGEAAISKQGLHVQSRSYWAPANIGPYSQAVVVPPSPTETQGTRSSLVYVAGQIPLDPPSMEFPARENLSHQEHFRLQSVLAAQHLWRIGQIMNVTHWLGAVAFISRDSETRSEDRVSIAMKTWRLANEPPREDSDDDNEEADDDVDIWDRVHGRQWSSTGSANRTMRKDILSDLVPPSFIAEVDSLPRNAPIEWASIGVISHSGRVNTTETRTDSHTYHTLDMSSEIDGAPTAGWVAVNHVDDLSVLDLPQEAASSKDDYSYTVYTTTTLSEDWVNVRQPTIVPCYNIWGQDGNRIAAVMAFRLQ